MSTKVSALPFRSTINYCNWELRHMYRTFVLITALLTVGSLLFVKAQDYGTTDAEELEALFEVLNGINPGKDWKTEIPEPCSGWSESIYCEPDNVTGEYHVTDLKFGLLSDEFDLIDCSGHAILHPAVGKLKFLETLQIFNCFVDEDASIPREVGQLRDSLQLLVLHDNPGLVGILPDELGNLTSLERLMITMTNVGGSIPQSMGDLMNLQQLDLSRNQLNGSIPASFDSLKNLKILDLGHNDLSGGLLPLSGMRSLLKLVLRANQLSGTIPDGISLLESLTFLDLSFNKFVGGLPASFPDLKSLEDLHLGHNDFGNFLPDFLDAMPALSIVDLANSGYEGEIPAAFGKMAGLRVLILKGNQISGMIPTSLQALPYLYRLDLSCNNLTGPVPFEVEFMEKMGSNLAMLNNTGLCIPPTTMGLAVGTMGVDLCLDASHRAVYSRGAQSPLQNGEGLQTVLVRSSHAPNLLQGFLSLLRVALILGIFLVQKL